MKNIVCIESCNTDYNMIRSLVDKCEVSSYDIPGQLAGLYVLAFDGSKLVGMANIFGESHCIVSHENKASVVAALISGAASFREHAIRTSGVLAIS